MISNNFILQELKRTRFQGTEEDVKEIIKRVRLFDNDARWQNKDSLSYETLIDDIVYDYSKGRSAQYSYSKMGESHHLDFFNHFLYEGAADDIINILKENGASADILKGIRYRKKDKTNKNPRFKSENFEIELKYEENPNDSLEIKEVNIYIGGQLINQWKKGDKGFAIVKKISRQQNESLENAYKRFSKFQEKQYSYANRNQYVQDVAVNPDNVNEYIVKYRNVYGDVKYRDNKGRFASKSKYKEWII